MEDCINLVKTLVIILPEKNETILMLSYDYMQESLDKVNFFLNFVAKFLNLNLFGFGK